jgi:uncharacterized protein
MDRKIIFRCKVGSHLYGLNTPESDIDYLSVFIPNSKDLLGLNKVEVIDNSTKNSSSNRRNDKDDIDDKMYSLPKFLHLLLQNNPNIVEVLFATKNMIETCEPEFKFLMDNYDKIISTKVFHTFTGYAYSQKKKLEVKRDRYYSLVESIKWIDSYFGNKVENPKEKITDFESDLLNQNLSYYKGKKGDGSSFHKGMPLKDIYYQLKAEKDKYGWRVKTDSFMKMGYDKKFAYHLIRILSEGIELLSTGKLSYPIFGEAKEDIMSVKEGELPLDDVFALYEKYHSKCEELKNKTTIRNKPDFNFVNDYLIHTLKTEIIKEGL